MALDAGDRLAQDAGESIAGVAVHADHLGHRQAGQIDVIEAGGDQHVAGLHVGIGRQKAQLEIAGAGAEQYRAQAIPDDLHRHRLVLVGDQGDFREQRKDPGHLADHAHLVDHHLARRDVVLSALVEDHPARKRVARRINDLGHLAAHRLAQLHLQQCAQALVLQFQMLLAQQQVGGGQLLAAQAGILLFQGGEAGKVIIPALMALQRRGGQALQRVSDQGHGLARPLQRVEAQVEHQQEQRQGDEKHQPGKGCRTAVKKRGRLVADSGNQG